MSTRTGKKTKGDNHDEDTSNLGQVLQLIIRQQQEITDRLEDLEKNRTYTGEAALRMINLAFATPREHLPELTRITSPAEARMHAIGMALEQLQSDPEVMSGNIPLSQLIRENFFRCMRSVGGIQLGRAIRVAEEQVAAAVEQQKADEMELGAID